jgi:diguanylate cyclase (GGDEF)-like protein
MVLVTVLFIALTISGWLLISDQEKQFHQESLQNGQFITNYVSKSLAYNVVGFDYHTIQLLLQELVQYEDIIHARVISPKGNIMAEVGTPPGEADDAIVISNNIVLDDKIVGNLVMGISNKRIVNKLDAQKGSLIKREVMIIILIALGEFLALSFLIIRPVATISKNISTDIDSDGSITHDIPIESNDEFGDVARRFNIMRQRLNDANARLHDKLESTDKKLENTNRQLVNQSEELKKINRQLEQMAITDPLTGLYNRRHFDTILRSEIESVLRYDDSCSIVLADIDRFKSVNDQYGHDVGDLVLKNFSDILKHNIRTTDVICRIGGEEFAILCRRSGIDETKAVAEKLRETIENAEINTNSYTLKLTASFGIATIPDEYTPINRDLFMKNADVSLYNSKEKGRNRVTHFSDLMNKKVTLKNA